MPMRTQVYSRPHLELIYTIHHEISKFAGTGAVIEWIVVNNHFATSKKLELVCDLCGVKQLVQVIHPSSPNWGSSVCTRSVKHVCCIRVRL